MDIRVYDRNDGIKTTMVDMHDRALKGNDLDLQAMKSLFHNDLASAEKEAVADILLTLWRSADKQTKLAIAYAFSREGAVPLRVALEMASGPIGAAKYILRHSPVLTDLDLAYIVKSKGRVHAREIAARTALGPITTRVLKEMKAAEIQVSLKRLKRPVVANALNPKDFSAKMMVSPLRKAYEISQASSVLDAIANHMNIVKIFNGARMQSAVPLAYSRFS